MEKNILLIVLLSTSSLSVFGGDQPNSPNSVTDFVGQDPIALDLSDKKKKELDTFKELKKKLNKFLTDFQKKNFLDDKNITDEDLDNQFNDVMKGLFIFNPEGVIRGAWLELRDRRYKRLAEELVDDFENFLNSSEYYNSEYRLTAFEQQNTIKNWQSMIEAAKK